MKIFNFVGKVDPKSKFNKKERKDVLNSTVKIIRSCKGFWKKHAVAYAKFNKSKYATKCQEDIFKTVELAKKLRTGLNKKKWNNYTEFNKQFILSAKQTNTNCSKTVKKKQEKQKPVKKKQKKNKPVNKNKVIKRPVKKQVKKGQGKKKWNKKRFRNKSSNSKSYSNGHSGGTSGGGSGGYSGGGSGGYSGGGSGGYSGGYSGGGSGGTSGTKNHNG